MVCVVKCVKFFLYYIVEEIEKCDMFMEFVFLFIVESVFDFFVYFYGCVVGMWQFIFGIGKCFGMFQNWWYDGCCDVVVFIKGVLDYFIYLNDMFDGDWFYVFVVYNSGEGRV